MKRREFVSAWACALGLVFLPGAMAQTESPNAAAKQAAAPEQTIPARDAIREVLAHPDFKHEDKQKFPRWKNKPQDTGKSDWIRSVEAFFRTLAKLLRAGVWVLAAIGIVLIVFTLHYWWRVRAQAPRSAAIAVPTHVGGLDIRAASLPDDIPAAARARWRVGDREGALSLLYRGALSRLVHQYACRIGASFTEDECVAAARRVLPESAHQYFAGQARIWVLAVYGRRWPDDASALALIDGYAEHFPRANAEIVSASTPNPRGAVA